MRTSIRSYRPVRGESAGDHLISWRSAGSIGATASDRGHDEEFAQAFREFEFHPSLNFARHAAPEPAGDRSAAPVSD